MTVEIRPYGDKCNLRCRYCYEHPLRDHNLPSGKPDYEEIKRQLKVHNTHFTVFGGDPLLVPIEELEEIWRFGKENWNQNGMQTNGSLMTSLHIALCKKYNVHVGFSIDGPHMLNDARSAPSGEVSATRVLTELSLHYLDRCLSKDIRCSLILTLHSLNATEDRLPTLLNWFWELEKKGLKSCRLHLMQDNNTPDLVMSDQELFEALISLYEFDKESPIRFDLFRELEVSLRTGKAEICLYSECDPFETTAVHGIGPNGEVTGCGHVNNEGIDFLKSGNYMNTRSEILQNTGFFDNGCQGCDFWYACKGFCPGTAINHDWRNKTVFCKLLRMLMRHIVKDKKITLLEPSQRPGARCSVNQEHINKHGDHYDDIPHGDVPHVNYHELPRLEVRR